MKSRRLYLPVLLLAIVSLLGFGASTAFATAPGAPTGVIGSGSNHSVSVGWHAPASNGGSAITKYTVTTTGVGAPGPMDVAFPNTWTVVAGLINGNAYTFTVTATSLGGTSVPSSASSAVTPSDTPTCQFDSFPAVPGSSSELAVGCTLDTAAGGLGTNFRIEDFPQVNWHQGAGRPITTTKSTTGGSKVITALAAHFTANDINNTISGPGIKSNSYIVAETSTTATLNKAPLVALGAKLIVNNSDGRTFTDAAYPATTVAAASSGADSTTLTSITVATGGTAKFPPSGQLVVATSDPAGAVLNYGSKSASAFLGVSHVSGIGMLATGGAVEDPHALYSPTAHFCRVSPLLTGCPTGVNAHTDVGRTVNGTRIPHGTTITAVNSLTSVTLSLPTAPCPDMVPPPFSGTPASICAQVGLSSPPAITSSREVTDAVLTGTSLASPTAHFAQTDVGLPIVCAGCVYPGTTLHPATGVTAAGAYIKSVTSSSVAVMSAAATHNTPATHHAPIAIGSRNSSAPLNNDGVMSLASELSVAPQEGPGLPSCDFNSAVGSNLVGKWENPGSFVLGGILGLPTDVTGGPIVAQLLVTTGPGNPAFAGYVVQAGASTPGDSDVAPHYDINFPSLLNGIAVCPEPNNVGVATTFRFFGETLSQSVAGDGDVRSFVDLPAGTPSMGGTAYEHIISYPSTGIADASGTCTINYPTSSAGYGCHGN